MLDTEIFFIVIGFLVTIIAAWIGARAATRAGKYQARAIIEAARISRGPRSDGKHAAGLDLLEFLLVVFLLLLLAMLVVLVMITVGVVDQEPLLRSVDKAISPLLY